MLLGIDVFTTFGSVVKLGTCFVPSGLEGGDNCAVSGDPRMNWGGGCFEIGTSEGLSLVALPAILFSRISRIFFSLSLKVADAAERFVLPEPFPARSMAESLWPDVEATSEGSAGVGEIGEGAYELDENNDVPAGGLRAVFWLASLCSLRVEDNFKVFAPYVTALLLVAESLAVGIGVLWS